MDTPHIHNAEAQGLHHVSEAGPGKGSGCHSRGGVTNFKLVYGGWKAGKMDLDDIYIYI